MSDFQPTHEIRFTPVNGRVQITRVMLADDGCAYTRGEWDAATRADWQLVDGEWRFQGSATPGGASGDVEVEELETFAGAEIDVELHRGTIDPAGEGSDDDIEACTDYVLDAIRDAFPGATVRAVGNGGRDRGATADGRDITSDVRAVANRAFDAWCGQAN